MTTKNPFVISGYVGPDYFCDREEESETIINALKNNRNLTLVSIRRMGKTALIQHVFHQLAKEKEFSLFYIDLMPTTSLKEFINAFGKTLLWNLDSPVEKAIKKVTSAFSLLHPEISFDPLTGMPSVGFQINNDRQAVTSIEKIFEYIKAEGKRVVVAFDEFQQISCYPEKNVEALLRSQIQFANNASFLFSGSRKHILEAMFFNQNRPFYQSTQLLTLSPIQKDKYKNFIHAKFLESGRIIKIEDIEFLLEWCRNHTYYIQYVCNMIYGNDIGSISSELLRDILQSILKEKEAVFFNYRNLLTESQYKLLKAIAKEDGVEKPYASGFISAYKLGAASAVNTALTALLNKEMIFKDQEKYQVYDLFLSRWLAMQSKGQI
ncbi:MAG: ATP-binding protein [Bacteroidetes bacterium]|nr:ATP-binding protein [Bacteroidota bacterium]